LKSSDSNRCLVITLTRRFWLVTIGGYHVRRPPIASGVRLRP
jgi:hypothetical protein